MVRPTLSLDVFGSDLLRQSDSRGLPGPKRDAGGGDPGCVLEP